jgi:hypothetical protein
MWEKIPYQVLHKQHVSFPYFFLPYNMCTTSEYAICFPTLKVLETIKYELEHMKLQICRINKT